MKHGARVYHEDNLVIRWRNADKSIGAQGKRVPESCPITADERAMYVKRGSAATVRLMMDNRGIGLTAAWEMLKEARGKVRGGY